MYNKKIFLSVVVLALLFILGVSFFVYKRSSNGNKDTSLNSNDIIQAPVNPQKGDVGYEEKNTVIETDSGSKMSGSLVSVDESAISINSNGEEVTYSLNENEIAVQCTDQKLLDVTSVDAGLVTDVKIIPPSGLSNLTIDEPVFLVGTDNAGAINVHTIFVASEVCQRL